MVPPRSLTSEAAWLRKTSEAAPRQRASDGGKWTPISPSAMVPSSASVKACKTDIGIAMADQLLVMRNGDAAQDHRIARRRRHARHSLSDAHGPAAREPAGCSSSSAILRSSAVVSLRLSSAPSTKATSRPNHSATPASSVKLARGLLYRGAMGGEDRLELETLRRLRPPQLIALGGADHSTLRAIHFKRVGDGQAGKGALMRTEAVDDAVDQLRSDEGPCRVVDQHGGGRFAAPAPRDRREPSPAACAPPRTALRKRPREGIARRVIERLVVGMDHDENVVDARMLGERGNGAREHRHAADRPILLGAVLLASSPRASACRHDERRHTHKLALRSA